MGSTPLRMCNIRRIYWHKTFKDNAQKEHCALGRAFGFNLHIITIDILGIIDLMVTKGNICDMKATRFKHLVAKL